MFTTVYTNIKYNYTKNARRFSPLWLSEVLQNLTNLLVEVFPIVLSHESEQREERPAERVEAGVAIVWITASFHTNETLWTESVNTQRCQETQAYLCYLMFVLTLFKKSGCKNLLGNLLLTKTPGTK